MRALTAVLLIGTLALAGTLVLQARAASSQEGPAGTIAFEGSDGLYLVDAAGGTARKIPGTLPRDGDPAWSPDGTRIVFDRGGEDRDIWVMQADGRSPRRLTFAPGDDGWPHWAPHGNAVTFESDRDAGEFVFSDEVTPYVVNLTSGQARRVASRGYSPEWRQDGRIGFQNLDYHVVTVLPYGGGRRIEAREPAGDGRWGIQYSRDGGRMVFTDGADPPTLLYTSRTDGRGQKLVFRAGEQEIYNPSWSPDGGWITFSMGVGDHFDVYVIRTDGTGLMRLTRVPRNRTACCSSWAPA